jgi:hypothetical protein
VTRRTGVIVGITPHPTLQQTAVILEKLNERFPGVTFSVVPGASSVTFEFELDDEEDE